MSSAGAGSETSALIERIAAGDRDAFSRFYDLTAPMAFGLIRRVLRDPEAAAEVLQEVFWQVWQDAPRYDPTRGTPEAWLVMRAKTRAIDRLRSIRRRRAPGSGWTACAGCSEGRGCRPHEPRRDQRAGGRVRPGRTRGRGPRPLRGPARGRRPGRGARAARLRGHARRARRRGPRAAAARGEGGADGAHRGDPRAGAAAAAAAPRALARRAER